MRTSRQVAFLILVLIPSAWLAWQWRAMPQLGFYHDDSLYFVSAKSLAAGHGYRIASLPGQPFQTKYPPLFPALLALVWKLNPNFPANLPLAVGLVWCFFPIYLALVWLLWREYEFSLPERMALTALAALNPLAVLFSLSAMPELLFTALLLASVLAAKRSGLLAGALAAAAYLVRSAALPLLVTVPMIYIWQRQYRKALQFVAVMLPVVAAWQVWVWMHLSKATDIVTLYYTNYFGYRNYNIGFGDFPRVIWYNLDAFLMSMGTLLTFDVVLSESRHLERIVAVAAIAGTVRLARTAKKLQYPMAGLAFSLMLLIWHYQPDGRLIFPLYPLLLAGLWTEAKNVLRTVQAAWRSEARPNRIAAGAVAAVLAGFGIFVLSASVSGVLGFIPRVLEACQRDLASKRPAYRWLTKNVPETAGVFAYEDPLIYLYAGRPSCRMPIPTKFIYHDDPGSLDRMVDAIPEFAREQHLGYAMLTANDFDRDLHGARVQRLAEAVRADPGCRQLYQSAGVSIYALH